MVYVQNHWNRDDWMFSISWLPYEMLVMGASAILLQYEVMSRLPLEDLFLFVLLSWLSWLHHILDEVCPQSTPRREPAFDFRRL